MEDLFNSIKRIISEGGRIYVKNKKGLALDITEEMKEKLNGIKSIDETLEDLHKLFLIQGTEDDI